MHDEVSAPHSKVSSLRVNILAGSGNRLTVHTYSNCHGTWNYGKKGHDRRATYDETNRCVSFPPTDEARPVHFELQVVVAPRNKLIKVPQTLPLAKEAENGRSMDPRADAVRQALANGGAATIDGTHHRCPSGCSGHGSCVDEQGRVVASSAAASGNTKCVCNKGWGSDDCSRITVLSIATADMNSDGQVSLDEFRIAMSMYGYPGHEARAEVSEQLVRTKAVELWEVDAELAMEMVADRASLETLSELLKDVRVMTGRGAQGDSAGVVVPAKQPPPPPLTAADVDSDNNGRVSQAELRAAVAASTGWVEAEKRTALSAALDLLALDPELAVEMVADGASPAVMRRLAQESAGRQAKEAVATRLADETVAGPESAGITDVHQDLPAAPADHDPVWEALANGAPLTINGKPATVAADGTITIPPYTLPLTINGQPATVAADGTIKIDPPPPSPPPSVLTAGTMDSNHNGQVSSQELSSAIAGSVGVWEEAEKLEVGAAAITLHAMDPDLAVEMVADGAGAEMLRHLAEESAALQSAPRRPKEPPPAAAQGASAEPAATSNPPPPKP